MAATTPSYSENMEHAGALPSPLTRMVLIRLTQPTPRFLAWESTHTNHLQYTVPS